MKWWWWWKNSDFEDDDGNGVETYEDEDDDYNNDAYYDNADPMTFNLPWEGGTLWPVSRCKNWSPQSPGKQWDGGYCFASSRTRRLRGLKVKDTLKGQFGVSSDDSEVLRMCCYRWWLVKRGVSIVVCYVVLV